MGIPPGLKKNPIHVALIVLCILEIGGDRIGESSHYLHTVIFGRINEVGWEMLNTY
jgi:hypothetical protein